MPPSLADIQNEVKANLPVLELGPVVTALHASVSDLVRVTDIESRSAGRNLVSATILADILIGVCQYCNVRGWNADRLVDYAKPRLNSGKVQS